MSETRAAREVFAESRTTHAGSTASHRPNQAAFECPRCVLKDPPDVGVAVRNNPSGRPAFKCDNGHEYLDNDELMNLRPRMLQVKPQTARQEGYETVPIQIPSSLRVALLARLGTAEKIAATLAAVMNSLAEPNTFLINTMDAQRLGQILGTEVLSGPALVGQIYRQNEELKESREKVTTLERTLQERSGRPASAGSPVADSGRDPLGVLRVDVSEKYDQILSLAIARGIPKEEVIANCVRLACQNNWI